MVNAEVCKKSEASLKHFMSEFYLLLTWLVFWILHLQPLKTLSDIIFFKMYINRLYEKFYFKLETQIVSINFVKISKGSSEF